MGTFASVESKLFLPFFYGFISELVWWWAPEESDGGTPVEAILPLMLSCENQSLSFLGWEFVAALLTSCSRQVNRSCQPELWSDCPHQCFFLVPCGEISTLRVLLLLFTVPITLVSCRQCSFCSSLQFWQSSKIKQTVQRPELGADVRHVSCLAQKVLTASCNSLNMKSVT